MSKNSNLRAQQSETCSIFAATFVVQDRKQVSPFLRVCCILLRTRWEGRRPLHFVCTGLSWGFLYIFRAYLNDSEALSHSIQTQPTKHNAASRPRSDISRRNNMLLENRTEWQPLRVWQNFPLSHTSLPGSTQSSS